MTGTKTVPMELMRASRPAVVSEDRGGIGAKPKRMHINPFCTCRSIKATYLFMSQCSTTHAAATSSCARTDSVSRSTLCVTMTTTAVMAQMSLRSVVSGPVTSYSGWGGGFQRALSPPPCCSPVLHPAAAVCPCRVSNMCTQRVPLCQRPLPHPELMGVRWRLRLPRPIRRGAQESTLHRPG